MSGLRFIILISVFTFQSLVSLSQDNKAIIDSLEKEISTEKDSNLVKIYNELTWQYRFVSSDKAIECGNKAIELGKKVDFKKGIAQAYNDLGIIYFDKQDFTEALRLYNLSMEMRSTLGDKKGIAALYNKMGILFRSKGEYSKALENQQQALSLYETLENDIGISYSLNNIADIYEKINDNEGALKIYFRSIDIKLRLKDDYGLAGTYSNIANIFAKQKKYKEAINYFNKSLELSKNINDKDYLHSTLNDLSVIYINLKDYKKALQYLNESYKIRNEIGDKKAMISCLINYGNIYLKTGEYNKAGAALDTALNLSAQTDANTELPALYGILSTYYDTIGNYKKALEYQRLQFAYQDSLINKDVNTKITEMNARFEAAQKENQINLQNKEITRQKTRNIFLIVSLALMVIIGWLLFNRNKLKVQRQMQEEKITQERLRIQSIMMTQEEERKHIAGELHDGLGQVLAAARLNIESHIQKTNATDEQINNALNLVDRSCTDLRSISHSLMPSQLTRLGLMPALKDMCERINTSNTIHFTFDTDENIPKLESSMEINLFRIVQEWTNNIIKYAQASEASLQFTYSDGELVLMMEDNGKGFDKTLLEKSKGNGWYNINSRLQLIKGTIEIDSRINKGTLVSVYVPMGK